MPPEAPNTMLNSLDWLAPSHRPAPAEALQRIQLICGIHTDLFAAMLLVVATHQSVPREMLAASIKQFRRDTDALTREDVMGLMVAILNGGRQGFDAVLRTRKGLQRGGSASAAALPWASG